MTLEWKIRPDQDLGTEKYWQDILLDYLASMTRLLLREGMRESKVGDEARIVGRARTAVAFRSLDPKRIEQVVRFLREADLVDLVDLSGILLSHGDYSRVNFTNFDLSNVDFFNSTLSYSSFIEANLRGACLRQTKGDSVWFRKADMTDADLRVSELPNASFYSANLAGADLSEAILRSATFTDANLKGTQLIAADLRGADFRDTNLREAEVWDVYYDESTKWPTRFDLDPVGAKYLEGTEDL